MKPISEVTVKDDSVSRNNYGVSQRQTENLEVIPLRRRECVPDKNQNNRLKRGFVAGAAGEVS